MVLAIGTATMAVIAAPAAAVGSTLAISMGAASLPGALLAAAGPPGWLALGSDGLSWDCWKPILRDSSAEPSKGRLLKDVVLDSRVKEVKVVEKDGGHSFLLKNQWGENFNIDYVLVHGELALHTTKC